MEGEIKKRENHCNRDRNDEPGLSMPRRVSTSKDARILTDGLNGLTPTGLGLNCAPLALLWDRRPEVRGKREPNWADRDACG